MQTIDATKINEYKAKLATLESQTQTLDRQMILLEEQEKQYNEKIMQAFNTTDPEALQKIADGYQQDIENFEAKLEAVQHGS